MLQENRKRKATETSTVHLDEKLTWAEAESATNITELGFVDCIKKKKQQLFGTFACSGLDCLHLGTLLI